MRRSSDRPAAPPPSRLQRLAVGSPPHRRLITVGILIVLLLPVSWSYGRALGAPGNTSFGVRTVEWIKDHNLAWAVNDFEKFWYNRHAPQKGGEPSGGLAAVLGSGADQSTATTTTSSPNGLRPVPTTIPKGRSLPPPPAIAPAVTNPLPSEGKWTPFGEAVAGRPAMYAAYVRPDAVYTSLVTGVVWLDPALARVQLYAGVQEPGGGGWKYQAPIAATDRSQLLAAFNSGFKLKDSDGGYYADGKTARAMRDGAATLVIGNDGVPNVGQWGRDVNMGPNVAAARQNLSLIVDGGQPVAGLATDSIYKWGATLGNKVLVWRSGVGVTANGALLYAGGNSLSISMLANVLSRAGAVRAMELDINSAWVDFFSYGPPSSTGTLTGTKLLPDMSGSSGRYLGDNSRDFFAVLRRA